MSFSLYICSWLNVTAFPWLSVSWKKKTILIPGASPYNYRFSFMAAKKFIAHAHNIVLVGLQKGEIAGNMIFDIVKKLFFEKFDAITSYKNPVTKQSFTII